MYLMNAPPVAVTRTEWRTCGTSGGYSLPLCLNDSDSDLSSRGTPISDKVQMIIESLRSTQSSVEMGDENERNVLSGHEGHPQVCKVTMASNAGANSKAQGATVNQQDILSIACNDSQDSDSDDSVDRGIEEAILEYLKEKDGPKQKEETCSDDVKPLKSPRSPSPIPGISQHNSDSCTFLTASQVVPKSVTIEKQITPTTYPIKKYIKHKASITEGLFTKQEANTPLSIMNEFPIGQTNQASKYMSELQTNPEESTDSSSDDGIEEAIQQYQMEKHQQHQTETQNVHKLSEDSDSTSDDGIEEAIRRYQLEQLKKKKIFKPLENKATKTGLKCATKGLHEPNTETMKKNKLKRKKNKKDVLSVNMPNIPAGGGPKGNFMHSFKVEGFKQQSSPKTKTTAELMCAEAILDISKTMMPGAFEQPPGLANTSSVDVQCSLPDKLEDGSDDSSIDSEDGIELEIRRFLEQKAQLQKQSSVAAPEQSENESEAIKPKGTNRPGRLSLTKKKKQKTAKLNFSTMSELSNIKGTMSSEDSDDKSTPSSPVSKLQKRGHGGDKSSSFDSDEDLDLAIKDLLKTKKKIKKKTRDLKRKPDKSVKKELRESFLPSKKSKLDLPNQSNQKPTEKNSYELSYSTLPKDDIFQAACIKGKDYVIKSQSESCNETQTKLTKDEDSSVDSDDSIELEIQKFLAEKAKIATAETNRKSTTNGTSQVCAEKKAVDVKQEDQQAEISSESIPFSGQSNEHVLFAENNTVKDKWSPQQVFPKIIPSSVRSLCPSSPTCSQSLLEPSDRAGASTDAQRTQKMLSENIQDTSKGQSVQNPNLTASQSASIKWRQSLGLPIIDTKMRTPFQVTSSKQNETASTARPYQSVLNFKVQNPVWSNAKPSFTRNTDTGFHPSTSSFASSTRPHPGPFTQALASDRTSQFPIEEETKSMVHISKDKSVYVELETNRTNHVQVRNRDRSECKEDQGLLKANGNEITSGKMEEKLQLEIKEESFIDEADYDSGNKCNQEKKQGLSTLSLSSAIDPGFTFKPCIALTTEERSERFSKKCMDNKCRKGKLSWRSGNLQQSVQHVKRRLQFVPVLRRSDATTLHY